VKLLLQRVADPFDSLEVTLFRFRNDITGKLLNNVCAGSGGTDFERVLPLQFQEQGNLFQRRSKVFTSHGRKLGGDSTCASVFEKFRAFPLTRNGRYIPHKKGLRIAGI
jgi:hypothetical protein